MGTYGQPELAEPGSSDCEGCRLVGTLSTPPLCSRRNGGEDFHMDRRQTGGEAPCADQAGTLVVVIVGIAVDRARQAHMCFRRPSHLEQPVSYLSEDPGDKGGVGHLS